MKEKKIYDKEIIEQLETEGVFVSNPICINCLKHIIGLLNDNMNYIEYNIRMLDKDFYSLIAINNAVVDKLMMKD